MKKFRKDIYGLTRQEKNKAVFMLLIHFSHWQSSKQKTNQKNTFLCSQTNEYSVFLFQNRSRSKFDWGYCKGFNSSKKETLYTLDILTYTCISFCIPFCSVEIDFVDQDDRETHLNIEFIRLMSISFSVQLHSVPLRHILEIKMMIEKHTWTLNFFL